VLIDKALSLGLRPVAARGTHHRRDGLISVRPSAKGKQKWPSPGGGRGHHSLAYEQRGRPLEGVARSSCGAPRSAALEVRVDLVAHTARLIDELFHPRRWIVGELLGSSSSLGSATDESYFTYGARKPCPKSRD
jgi:hypothetical protein